MEWISVDDKLPEVFKTVICVSEENYISVDYLEYYPRPPHVKWYDVEGGLITHWMPLPECPEKG